jgi:ElaB/YqjD/DUF883 family membrane-anchored ribosome-binding protein
MGQDTEELKREIESTRSEMSETLEAIGDRVSPGRIVQRKKNLVSSKAQSVRERVMGTTHSAQSAISDTAGQATDAVKHLPDTMSDKAQGAPMIAGAIAFGVGFLVAAAFPPSRAEKEASIKVMESAEPMKAQLMESAHEVADHLKEPAMESAQVLKNAATEGAQAVTSATKDAAAETKEKATESAQAVKSGT